VFRGFGSGIGMRPRTKAILAAVVVATLGMLYVFSREPSTSPVRDDCRSKGIDPQQKVEGTCEIGGTKTVVVDRGHLLEMETLEARLVGFQALTKISGPAGVKAAKKGSEFVTFEVEVTNRTDEPQSVGGEHLAIAGGWFEDLAVERHFEPRSLLARRTPIEPGETATGTVTFEVVDKGVADLHKEGNLDIDNFDAGDGDYEPESFFERPELGVMRTY
jgi:hypothetical protein